MEAIEQQIYASLDLPEIKAGHHTHAATPGLNAAAIERHEGICNRWGQYESTGEFQRSLLHMPLWLESAPPEAPSHHIVALITYQGRDAGGRPGAMLRHVVRLSHDSFARIDFQPFHLLRSGLLLEKWTPEQPFPDLSELSDRTTADELKAIFPERYSLLRALLEQLLGKGRLHLPTATDSPAVEETLSQLLELVPTSERPRLASTSFAYANASDYALAAVRRSDASFRRSLEEIQSTPPAALPAPVGAYVESLFNALQARSWDRAVDLIHQTDLDGGPVAGGDSTDDAMSPPPTLGQEGTGSASVSAATASPSSREGAVPFGRPTPPRATGPTAASPHATHDEEALSAAEFEPSFRRQAPTHRRGSGGRIVAAVVVVALLGLAGFLLLQRRGGSSAPPSYERDRLQSMTAGSLASLVEGQEQLLGNLITDGSRDFDLQESMGEALASWGDRVSATMQKEADALDKSLAAAASSEAGLAAYRALSKGLRDAGSEVEGEGRRLAGLYDVLSGSDVAPLRSAYDEKTHTLSVAPARGNPEDAAVAPAFQWAGALSASAGALDSWIAAAETGRDGPSWHSAADELSKVMVTYPKTAPPPPVLRAAQAVADDMSALLAAESSADLGQWGGRMDYPAGELSPSGALGKPAAKLLAALAPLESSMSALPPSLELPQRFYRGGQAMAAGVLGPGVDAAGAKQALELGRSLCPEPTEGACAVATYAPNVARWKLEAWASLGGPDSGSGKAALQELGAGALPGGDAAELARMLSLLTRMRSARLPASAALVEQVRQAQGAWKVPIYRQLSSSWLRAQEHTVQSQRSDFKQLYTQLKSATAALKGADAEQAEADFGKLRRTLAQLDRLGLDRAAGVAGQADEVAAVKKLQSQIEGPITVPLSRCKVQLLVDHDYSGAKQSLARIKVEIREPKGASLVELELPPMLSAPGAGFEAVDTPVGKSLSLAADQRLLVLGRDAVTGHLWFHYYLDPSSHGTVVSDLARPQEVHVTADAAAKAEAAPQSPPASAGAGEAVARVEFVLGDPWWSLYSRALPDLP